MISVSRVLAFVVKEYSPKVCFSRNCMLGYCENIVITVARLAVRSAIGYYDFLITVFNSAVIFYISK